MRLRFFGGFGAFDDAGTPIDVPGRGQRALLSRLALDAGTAVSYRALAEDVWPVDGPEDPRAALQSLVSRMRRALPPDTLRAAPGGYLIAVGRSDVDLDAFADLVVQARRAEDTDAARAALALWTGDPWTPDGFDWVIRDLLEDRAHAERLVAASDSGTVVTAASSGVSVGSGRSGSYLPDLAESPEPAAPFLPHVPASATPGVATPDTTIPAAVTTLIGREHELDLIARQLDAERLVTLIGPGGAGKTTLSLETARRHPPAVFVELAPAAAGEVWDAVATAVGRSIRIGETALSLTSRDRALMALAGRAVLLVLDNAEHVIAETAGVVADILRAADTVRLLVTSREPLGVPGEAFVELGPLPDADAEALLSARIRAARGVPPSQAEAEAVARIARRLDGLPLALELAGAKTRVMGIAEIEAGLADRFALLDRGPRAAEPRHQTLRAVIDWSWGLLDDRERRALPVLAVFPDGVDAADAQEVAAAFDIAVSDLDELVDRSLVQRSRSRYRLLETVREYGLDVLRRQGDLDRLRDRQAEVMARLALRRDGLLRTRAVREGVAWFDANEENLSAATRWCGQHERLLPTGVLLVRGQFWVWLMRERSDPFLYALEHFGPSAETLSSEPEVVVVGLALLVSSFVRNTRPGEDEIARLGEAVTRHRSEVTAVIPAVLHAAYRALSDQPGGAGAGGAGPWGRGIDFDEADVEDAPVWSRAFIAVMRAAVAQNNGVIDVLGDTSERALRLFREAGDIWGTALASQMRSEWLMLHGRLDEALAIADEASAGLEGLTSVTDLVQQRSLSVTLLLRMGRVDEARERVRELVELAEADGSDRVMQQVAATEAALEVATGDGAAALIALERGTDLDALAILAGENRERDERFPEQVLAARFAVRAAALVLVGDLEEARLWLQRAAPIAARSGDQPIMSQVALVLGDWFLAAGRIPDARAALAEAGRLRGMPDESAPLAGRLRECDDDEGSDAAASDPVDLAGLVARL